MLFDDHPYDDSIIVGTVSEDSHTIMQELAMVVSQKALQSVAAPRPAEDRLEVRLENEPDTPMHHAHRQAAFSFHAF